MVGVDRLMRGKLEWGPPYKPEQFSSSQGTLGMVGLEWGPPTNLSSLAAAKAHWVTRGSWLSAAKHLHSATQPTMEVIAVNWARDSLISSS